MHNLKLQNNLKFEGFYLFIYLFFYNIAIDFFFPLKFCKNELYEKKM